MDLIEILDDVIILPIDLIKLIDNFCDNITCSRCDQHTEIMYEIEDDEPFSLCYDCFEQYLIDTLFEEDFGIIHGMYSTPTESFYKEDMEDLGDTLLVFYKPIF